MTFNKCQRSAATGRDLLASADNRGDVPQPLSGRLCSAAAESAHQVNDQEDKQNKANTAAANGRAAKIKSSSAKQQEKNDNQE